MDQFNNNNGRHRQDELFQSDSDFQLNLSLRSNFRVPTQNSTTSNSPQKLAAKVATATSQDEETLTSQANDSHPQPHPRTKQKKSESEQDEIIFDLTRQLSEQSVQLKKANEKMSILHRESATDKEHLQLAGKTISDLRKELKEKKGQLVNNVVAKERANKVEKFLTTVSGELGTFVKMLNSLVAHNVPQVESKFLVFGPFQTHSIKNEFIQLMTELATHISTNSATVEVVRDFLVNINTVLNKQVNVTPDVVPYSPPQPQNLTSNTSLNGDFREGQQSSKRFCRGIHRQAKETASSTLVPNSHLLINPPPLVPSIRPTPSSSSTRKQSTYQSIRATPSSGNHAQYTLQIMETTSFSSFAHAQSTVTPNQTASHLSTHAQPMLSHPYGSSSSSSTHAQSPVSNSRDAPYPCFETISLISPPLSTTPTPTQSSSSLTRDTSSSPSTHAPSKVPDTRDSTIYSSNHSQPLIPSTRAVPSSVIHIQSIPPTRVLPPYSIHVQSTSSHSCASPSSPTTHALPVTSPNLATQSFSSTPTKSTVLPIRAAPSPSFSIQAKSIIPSSSRASPSSCSTHEQSMSPLNPSTVTAPPQQFEVNSLTPLTRNGRSPQPSTSRSTIYIDHGLDLSSSDRRHGIDPSFQLANVCLCGGTFRTKATLKMHIQNNTTEGNFECDICKRCFHYPSVVKEHMMSAHKVAKRHNDKRIFICYICQKDDLGSWEEFQDHLYKIHFRTPHRRR